MMRFRKKTIKSPKYNDNLDLTTLEMSSDLNEDLSTSSTGFNLRSPKSTNWTRDMLYSPIKRVRDYQKVKREMIIVEPESHL